MSEANETQSLTGTEPGHAALTRVLNLAILFVGIGAFAAVGFGLSRVALFESLRLTYFAVGTVVGVVGLLLWILAR